MKDLKGKEISLIEEYKAITQQMQDISTQSQSLQQQYNEAMQRRNFVAGKIEALRELMQEEEETET